MEDSQRLVTLSFADDDNLNALLDGALKRKLDQVIEEKRRLSERYTHLEHMYSNQSMELDRIKEENENLCKQIDALVNKGGSDTQTSFIVSASRMHFIDHEGNHPPRDWVISFWLNMNDVADLTSKGIPIISNASQVGLVYKVVTEDNKLKYNYCGTREDFATEWNDNIAERQEKSRKQKLTCNARSLTASLNKSPYKGVSVTSWPTMALKGSHDSDLYAKGDKIKKAIESFFQ